MKSINPLFRKVLIEIKGLDSPLEMWWTDQFVEEFKEGIISNNSDQSFRVPNTPDSVIELHSTNFNGIQVTNEVDLLLRGRTLHLTQFHRFYYRLNFPVPRSTFNDEFEFPITIICLINKKSEYPITLDISNYSNLDYLLDRNISIVDHLTNSQEYAIHNFLPSSFLFAEYSKLS